MNLLDDPDAAFVALVNQEGQYSLWPASLEVPNGWETAFGPATREERLADVEQKWTEIRPRSLQRLARQNG